MTVDEKESVPSKRSYSLRSRDPGYVHVSYDRLQNGTIIETDLGPHSIASFAAGAKKRRTADVEEEEKEDESKLYCVCREPWNKRLMITCDVCEEWFHADCVGVDQAWADAIDSGREGFVCNGCSQRKQRRKCLGCAKGVSSGSLYCSSNRCIGQYVDTTVRSLNRHLKARKYPVLVKSDRICLFEPNGGRVLCGNDAPTLANLLNHLILHPTQCIGTAEHVRLGFVSAESLYGYRKRSIESNNTEKIRERVTKTLTDALEERAKRTSTTTTAIDIPSNRSDIEKMSKSIEEAMIKHFGSTSDRYMNRFRALVQNIRDKSNKDFCMRILKRELELKTLVTMDVEDMASDERRRQRQEYSEQRLRWIEQSEEEAQNCKQNVNQIYNSLRRNGRQDTVDDIEPIPTDPDVDLAAAIPELPVIHHKAHLSSITTDDSVGTSIETPQANVHTEIISPGPVSADYGFDCASTACCWKGSIHYGGDLARVNSEGFPIHASYSQLAHTLPRRLTLCGRLPFDQVWQYLCKVQGTVHRELAIMGIIPINESSRPAYEKLFDNLILRNRVAVANVSEQKTIKDCYIVPFKMFMVCNVQDRLEKLSATGTTVVSSTQSINKPMSNQLQPYHDSIL